MSESPPLLTFLPIFHPHSPFLLSCLPVTSPNCPPTTFPILFSTHHPPSLLNHPSTGPFGTFLLLHLLLHTSSASALSVSWPFQVSIRPALCSHYHSTSNRHWHFLTHTGGQRAEALYSLLQLLHLSHLFLTFLSCVATSFSCLSVLICQTRDWLSNLAHES